MKVTTTPLPGVLLIEPTVFADQRGFFYEAFNSREFARQTGTHPDFVQDNHSRSVRGALRGLHYQINEPQGKLIRVSAGEVFDVAVDLRRNSPSFGRWTAACLSSENKQQLWIPPGFAHGFLVLSDYAEVQYKTTTYWSPQDERCIRWDDPSLAIDWPLATPPILSAKDQLGVAFNDAETFS